ncbi:hypothetical protein FNF27_00989 [Cafeteria roenbergensis]|uniref:Uncharacterized protein n=1 Tax=Cafeteria roenbergensis TaxID=33653 RepID=A0A5A8EL21_CAFRO|nr:hypothetical protein FNF27_00989 [Cafeteria roenbergensis]
MRRALGRYSALRAQGARAASQPASAAYVTTLLKQCNTASDVLEVFESEIEAFDPFNYGAAGARMLALHKGKALHKREALPRSRVARFLAGMAAALQGSPAAPQIGVLASMARAAAELGLEDRAFWSRLASSALPQIATAAKPRDVAMLAAALTKGGVQDAQLVQALGDRFASSPGRYTLIEAQMLAACMADTGLVHREAADAIETRMVEEGHRLLAVSRPKPHDVAAAASAVAQAARLGRLDSPVFAAFRPFVMAHARRMGPRELSNTAHAFASTGRAEFLPVVKECLARLTHAQRLEAATPSDATLAARALVLAIEGARVSGAVVGSEGGLRAERAKGGGLAVRTGSARPEPALGEGGAPASPDGGAAAVSEAGDGAQHASESDSDGDGDGDSGSQSDEDGAAASDVAAAAARSEAVARARKYLDADAVLAGVSRVMIRHLDPAAAGRDALSLALADARSSKGRAGPFHRYPTVTPSPTHCLHALEAARDAGTPLSEEAAAKIADRLAKSLAGMRPTEAARAVRLIAAAAPPRRAGPALGSLVRHIKQNRWRAFDADPNAAAAASTALLAFGAQAATAPCATSRLAPRDRSVEPLPPRVAEALASLGPLEQLRPAARRAAARALQSVALRGSSLTVKQRAGVAWAAGTSRQPAPEVMAATAASLARWTATQRHAGIVAPTVVGIAASGHPCWAEAGSPLRSVAGLGPSPPDIVVPGFGAAPLDCHGEAGRPIDWFATSASAAGPDSDADGSDAAVDASGTDDDGAAHWTGAGPRPGGGLLAAASPSRGGRSEQRPRGAARAAQALDRFWQRSRMDMLGHAGADGSVGDWATDAGGELQLAMNLRRPAAAWLRRAVSRERVSAMPVAAVAWAIAAGAADGAAADVSPGTLIDGLRLGASGRLPGDAAALQSGAALPPRVGPGETMMAAEAALLLGGLPLLHEVVENVPWLRAVLGGARKDADRARAPLASGAVAAEPLRRAVAAAAGGNGNWEAALRPGMARLREGLQALGWEAVIGGTLSGGALTSDLLLRRKGDDARSSVAVVAESQFHFWAPAGAGLLPPERVRRRLLRTATGGPLLRVDAVVATAALVSPQDGATDLLAQSLAEGAAMSLQARA